VNDEWVAQRNELRRQLHDQLNGKPCLIGWIATGTVDFETTAAPAERPGVVVHGVIASSILTGNFLYRAPGLERRRTYSARRAACDVSCPITFQGLNALFVTVGIAAVYTLLNCLVGYDWQKSR